MTMVTGSSAPAERFRKPREDDDVGDDIDLSAYIRTLWPYRGVIVLAALAFAAAAAAMALLGGRVYSAEASVMVSQSKIGERLETGTTIATFRPLLESPSIAASVIRELGLDKPPRNASTSRFFTDVVTVDEIRNSPVVVVRAVLDDPALAARAANLVAERAVQLSRRVSQQEASRSQNDLQQQRDDAKGRKEQADETLRKFREASQIELVRKDVDAQLGQRGELLALSIQIESEKARLAKAEQELASRQRIDTIKRSIDSDAGMLESARKASDAGNLLSLQTRNEFVNPVYEALDSQIAATRTTLAGLERKRTQIVDVRKLNASQMTQLSHLYQLEGELARLELEQELATAVYRQVSNAYETARMQVASRSAQLEILDQAVAPDRPVSRNVARNTVIGLLAGLVLASIAAALHSLLSNDARTAPIRRSV